MPGALVPQFYDTYLKTKNVGPLVAIVEHNKQDLVSLGTLFSRLFEEWNYD
ncbi:MAG: ribonuclease H-like domain-containing protein [Candidatus Bathyarchaeota archaeon]